MARGMDLGSIERMKIIIKNNNRDENYKEMFFEDHVVVKKFIC